MKGQAKCCREHEHFIFFYPSSNVSSLVYTQSQQVILLCFQVPLTLIPVTGRRLHYTIFSVDMGVTDVTKNSRLFTVTLTKCSTLLLAVFFLVFSTHRHPASTSPAHPVSVPIHPIINKGDESSAVTSFETGICIPGTSQMQQDTRYIPGTRYILYSVWRLGCFPRV